MSRPKFILIGYADTRGMEKPIVIATEKSDAERAAIFHDAKHKHKFPKDIKCLEMFPLLEPSERAEFISAEIAGQIQGREQQRLASIEAEQKKNQARLDAEKTLADAHENVRKAAVTLNNASAKLQLAKNRLLDAESNFKTTKTDSHKQELETAKAQVAAAQESETKARDELNAAKKTKAELIAGKTPAPDENAA